MIIRKSRARDRADGRRRRRRRRARSRCSRSGSSPGISMIELDRIADEYIRSHGGVPTSKGYKGFPAATCISPNDMIVHGIPGDYRAREGDIISFDVGVTKDGMIADSAATFAVGEISRRGAAAARRLPRGARRRDRGGPARRDGRRHLRGRADGGRGRRLLGRPQPRRPRRRQGLPRGPAGAELRHRLPRRRARRGDDDRDRADDHRRRPRRLRRTTTTGRSRPSTARSRPTSSTPSRSPRTARGCSRRPHRSWYHDRSAAQAVSSVCA